MKPELAGSEETTSLLIREFVKGCEPDHLIVNLGGYGLAAVFNGKRAGPRVMVRCELDALPIPESIDLPYGSKVEGVAHKCGHDGHMTIVAGLAARLHTHRPPKGTVILLFQPSEETGEGARLVLSDPKFGELYPDYALALHNLPGFPLGQVVVNSGVFASASSGFSVHLRGETSHAAEPESGHSPALAVAQLIQAISAIPQFHTSLHQAAQATVIHARVGEIAFGTSPGEGHVMATLRSHSEAVLDILSGKAASIARIIGNAFDLDVATDCTEAFPETRNSPDVVELIGACAAQQGMNLCRRDTPFAWSEDFGHFTARYNGALFGLGAGENHPVLHHPEYDFPEELIQPGIDLYSAIIRRLLD
jgi:amidohydrolase